MFFQLRDAFERYGKFRYHKLWTGTEVNLESEYPSVSENWQTESEEEERFKRTWLELLEDLYLQRIPAFGLLEDGGRCDIPDYVWKDLGTKVVFIREGYVRMQTDISEIRARVQIERSHLLARLRQEWIAEHPVPSAQYTARAGSNLIRDYPAIDAFIFQQFDVHGPELADLKCARSVVEIFNDSAPVESKLRERIKTMRDRGLI
jgi:hypothetical protein